MINNFIPQDIIQEELNNKINSAVVTQGIPTYYGVKDRDVSEEYTEYSLKDKEGNSVNFTNAINKGSWFYFVPYESCLYQPRIDLGNGYYIEFYWNTIDDNKEDLSVQFTANRKYLAYRNDETSNNGIVYLIDPTQTHIEITPENIGAISETTKTILLKNIEAGASTLTEPKLELQHVNNSTNIAHTISLHNTVYDGKYGIRLEHNIYNSNNYKNYDTELLLMNPETLNEKNLLKINISNTDKDSEVYDVYHTGFKPTPADIGAAMEGEYSKQMLPSNTENQDDKIWVDNILYFNKYKNDEYDIEIFPNGDDFGLDNLEQWNNAQFISLVRGYEVNGITYNAIKCLGNKPTSTLYTYWKITPKSGVNV